MSISFVLIFFSLLFPLRFNSLQCRYPHLTFSLYYFVFFLFFPERLCATFSDNIFYPIPKYFLLHSIVFIYNYMYIYILFIITLNTIIHNFLTFLADIIFGYSFFSFLHLIFFYAISFCSDFIL